MFFSFVLFHKFIRQKAALEYLRNIFEHFIICRLLYSKCVQSNSELVLLVGQDKSKVFQFCFGPRTLLLWCWFPRHLCSVAFVQVLRLCEHILYPPAKRPLALCNEVLIPVSQRFVFPRVICSPEHWALVLCVPPSPPYKTIQCCLFLIYHAGFHARLVCCLISLF